MKPARRSRRGFIVRCGYLADLTSRQTRATVARDSIDLGPTAPTPYSAEANPFRLKQRQRVADH
eukprot:5470566-Pyramimonas_sp.AAC.1